MKRAEVWHDRGWRGDQRPWTALVHDDGVIPDRAEQILYRDSSDEGHRAFPTHAEALAHALAEVGLDQSVHHREAP